jgi:putative addiction module CopG family antidote
MARRAARNISLTPELAAFIAAQVDSGRYGSASEVVRTALRLLEHAPVSPRPADLHAAEVRLAVSEERLSLAIAAAGVLGIWDGDLKRGLVYGDANFARIYGVDPAAAGHGMPRGHYFKDIHPDDLPAVKAAIDRLFAGASEYENEHRILRPDGSTRWVLTRGRLVREGDGTPIRFAGVSLDITERKLAEARQAFLLRLADRLRALSDPRAIVEAAVALLGRHLEANRVGFGLVQPDGASIALETCHAEGVAPLRGVFPLDGFGAHNVARQRQGQTVVHDDLARDPLADPAVWAAAEIGAFISVPLIRDGAFRASLFVNQRTPRLWTAAEVSLVEEVAARVWDAAERARTEADLRDSQAHLAALYAQTGAGVAEGDLEGRFLSVNDRYCQIVGRTRAEMVHVRAREVIHPDDYAANQPLYQRLLEHSVPCSIQQRYIRPDGSVVWCATNINRIVAPGRPPTLLVVATEISGLKQAEERLSASEARFRAAVAAVQGVLWTNSVTGAMTGEQPGWAALTGQSQAEYQGFGWAAAVHPDDAPATIAAWQAAVAERRMFRFEHRVRRHDGAWRIFSIRALPSLRADGTVLEWVGVHTDVTEQRTAEQRLREMNERLEQRVEERTRERDRVWELSEDLLAVADYEGRLLLANPAWSRLLGHELVTLLARPYQDLIHPDDLAGVMTALLDMRARGRPVRFENRMLAADGSWRVIAWRASPEPGGARLSGIGRDMTDVRAREAALATAQEALRQSQKMEAVGQLTGGLAHDFNNLLTIIAGSLEVLGARVAQGRVSELGRYLEAAQGSVRRAAALTHRLLAFSRRQPLDPRPTDVGRLVAELEDLLRRTVGPEITLEVAAAAPLWSTLVDPNQLENALLNLCINARDAMPAGGRLSIAMANLAIDPARARAWDMAPGDYVEIGVTDTGIGMTEEVAARAFDPFFTTKPAGQGTGLGLSMIYGFARQSGGQARIESQPGLGTTVRLHMPRHVGEPDVLAPAEPDAPGERARDGQIVLIVDDEPIVRMLVSDVVQQMGLVVLEAADGPAALQVLRSERHIDLLVTDIGLPGGIDGRQLAASARQARPGLRVLFMTGYAEPGLSGEQVIAKPFTMQTLAGRIGVMVA